MYGLQCTGSRMRKHPVLALAVVLLLTVCLTSVSYTPYERLPFTVRLVAPLTGCKGRAGLAADAISGVTGKLFQGRLVNVYSGSRLFSAVGPYSKHGSSNAPPLGNITSFNWAVVTTISKPSQQILDTLNLQGWAVVVVGDKGGASFQVSAPNLVFLDPAAQKSWAAGFPELLALLPWRHFGRKNLGYLYAIAHGATTIWDFDDDNGLKPGLVPALPNKDVYRVQVNNDCEAFNPYPLMGAPAQGVVAWPRGLPLNLIKAPCSYSLSPGNTSSVAVLQSLADHEPDVDGIFRLTRTIPFDFASSNRKSLVIPWGTLTPWNAQATLAMQPSLWSLLLPVTVHGRVSDIWRSYISQRLLWDIGMHIAFSPPLVTQMRNPHNALADMAAEHDLYFKSLQLVKFLRQWQGTAPTIAGRFEELMVQLHERDYVGVEDVLLTQQWLKALVASGYKFPPLTPQSWHTRAEEHTPKGPSAHAEHTTQAPMSQGRETRAHRAAIAVQGRASQLADWTQHLPRNRADLFYLAFDQPCPSVHPEMEDQIHCVNMPNSTWTEGRNQLAVEIYHHEVTKGMTYKYWSFFDADYLVNLQCAWCMGLSSTSLSPSCCIDRFIAFLLTPSTEYAMVAPSCLWGVKQECLEGPYHIYDNPCPDARANAFHRDAVPLFVPYSTLFDNKSWWMSQQILFYFAKHCLPSGSSVQVWGFASDNLDHAPYPRTQYSVENVADMLNATAPTLFNQLFVSQSSDQTLQLLSQDCGYITGATVSVGLSGAWRSYGAYAFCMREQATRFAEQVINASLL